MLRSNVATVTICYHTLAENWHSVYLPSVINCYRRLKLLQSAEMLKMSCSQYSTSLAAVHCCLLRVTQYESRHVNHAIRVTQCQSRNVSHANLSAEEVTVDAVKNQS